METFYLAKAHLVSLSTFHRSGYYCNQSADEELKFNMLLKEDTLHCRALMSAIQQAKPRSGSRVSDITLFLFLIAGLDGQFLESLHDVFIFILHVPGFPFPPILLFLLRLKHIQWNI